MSNLTPEFAAAFTAFQKDLPMIGKNATGHGYKYPSLAHVCNSLYPIMNKHGLSLSQSLDHVDGLPSVCTYLMHVSGGYIKGNYPISKTVMKGINDSQQFGVAIAYTRRYGTLSITGCPTDDNDAATVGNAASKAKVDPVGPDKDEATKLIEAAKSKAQVKAIATSCKSRAIAEDWINHLGGLVKLRNDEFDSAGAK